MIKKEKYDELSGRMARLGIREEDLIEKFVLGSGKGGQKINKTSSCVYLKHIPTGLEVKCQRERSRELNRYFARKQLCDEIEGQNKAIQTEKQQKIEKIRRQKRRRSRKAQAKVLIEKKRQGEQKSLRKPPNWNE